MGALARSVALAAFVLLLAGCGTLPRNAVPPELTGQAAIPGIPDVRAWAGQPSAAMERDFARSFEQESPADFPPGPDGRGPAREDIFVIHNGQFTEPPSPTPRSLRGITTRVLDATSRAGLVGDLFRIHSFALREQAGFHWVTITEGVEVPGAEVFDPEKMIALYEVGYRVALEGPVWWTDPPGLRRERTPP